MTEKKGGDGKGMEKNWYRLDTAALIFPAVMNRRWCNAFRISAALRDPVDAALLQRAVNDLMPRFPSFYVRLKSGFFWYRLEETDAPPCVREEYAFPLTHMSRRELSRCCLRVLVYGNRIACEIFHSVTDGTGGTVYFKNLLRRYVWLRYGTSSDADASCGIVSLTDRPAPGELEDSFFANAGPVAAPRRESAAFRLRGTREENAYKHLVTGTVGTDALTAKAKEYGCSVTAFLAAVMLRSLIGIQNAEKPPKRQRPVKVCVPVDLRRLYGSRTLRNFVLTVNVGVDPRQGEYSLRELCDTVSHQLKLLAVPQNMAANIAANVRPQRSLLVRIMPLPLKNLVMNAVYGLCGERTGCLNISNLGVVTLPPDVAAVTDALDFVIGVQKTYPNNCSVVSCGGLTRLNMIRNISESETERRFFSSLVELGIPVEIGSNG